MKNLECTSRITGNGKMLNAFEKEQYMNSLHLRKISLDFPGDAVVKNQPANAGDMGSSPGLGRSHMPWSSKAHVPQLLSPCATTTEARVPRVRARQQEKPPQ